VTASRQHRRSAASHQLLVPSYARFPPFRFAVPVAAAVAAAVAYSIPTEFDVNQFLLCI